MKDNFNVLKAEIIKEHHKNFHSNFIFISLFVWPFLEYFTIYFMYRPFIFEVPLTDGGLDASNLMTFLSSGYMAYICFSSMMQNAWELGWSERENGTLEMAFLSPANRLVMVLGKALGALLQDSWMFLVFCSIMLFYSNGITLKAVLLLPIVFLVLIISSGIWGGLMNVFYLFSRDATLIMTFFEDTMFLFTGVVTPLSDFPKWVQVFSLIFPLTYCIKLIRSIFMYSSWDGLVSDTFKLAVCLVIMLVLTILCLNKAEKVNRIKGELNFY